MGGAGVRTDAGGEMTVADGLDIDRIESSFDAITPKLDDLATLFYSDLFARHPEAKPLFKHVDLISQRRKISAMLTLIVTNLRRMDVLVTVLRTLGGKHQIYGATPESYEWVEDSLLRSIETSTFGPKTSGTECSDH